MLRCQAHEGCPKNGILAGGEDGNGLLPASGRVIDQKLNFCTNALTDPVFLHGRDLVGPTRQFVAVNKQVFRIVGDLEKPLRKIFLTNRFSASPAHTGLHLFVGQDCLAGLTPVDK